MEISELGAEVRAVINTSTEHGYMWSGDGRVWAGVSPVLFPVVGKSHDNKIKYQGKEYPMGNHGLARHTVFDIVLHSENSVILAMETSKEDYPFRLRFEVTYTLEVNKLITEYNIINLDDGVASCGFGAHQHLLVLLMININSVIMKLHFQSKIRFSSYYTRGFLYW